jgi:hypothetical protein
MKTIVTPLLIACLRRQNSAESAGNCFNYPEE